MNDTGKNAHSTQKGMEYNRLKGQVGTRVGEGHVVQSTRHGRLRATNKAQNRGWEEREIRRVRPPKGPRGVNERRPTPKRGRGEKGEHAYEEQLPLQGWGATEGEQNSTSSNYKRVRTVWECDTPRQYPTLKLPSLRL